MEITVEPRDGHELDRMITALLNVTGLVKQVIDAAAHPPQADGVAVIGVAAERLRRALAVLAEHRDDRELASVTQILAESTVLVAGDLSATR